MAETLNVACGGCGMKYQVPPVLAGRKIRCRNCQGVIPVPAGKAGAKAVAVAKPVAATKPVAAAKSAPAKAGAAAPVQPASEEWGAISSYEVIKESDAPRCPHCAHDMDEDEVVCLNCGYNTLTRERLPQKILEPVTGGDYFWWLLPGFITLFLALVNIFFMQSIFTHWPFIGFLDWMYFSMDNKAIPIYMAVFFAFDIWGLGLFSFWRLVMNPHPPDKEKKIEKEDDE